MSTTKLVPNDSRVQNCTANLNGVNYKYMLAMPTGTPKATIFLVHGWPDIGFGWRNQIPLLTSLGLRVVVPDMMGYGGTDAPDSITYYTYKRAADDLATLAHQLNAPQILLGGHDWGGMIVYMFSLHYPNLITSIFSICTPFFPPSKTYISLEESVATKLPNFKYQLQLSGPEVEAKIKSKEEIRQFLIALYGGRTETGEQGFTVDKGLHFEKLDKLQKSKLISDEELDYYVEQYSIHGLHGPLNWYRTREINHEESLALAEKGAKIQCPTLFVSATLDSALPPGMSKGMERGFEKELRRGEVESHHWCLWDKAEDCNKLIGEWVQEQVAGGRRGSKASL